MGFFDRLTRGGSACPMTGQGESGQKATKPVKVGWLVDTESSGFVYGAPERVRGVVRQEVHIKSAARCPGVVDMESRYFLIRCSHELHLRMVRDDKGKPMIRNMVGDRSPVRPGKMREILHVVPEKEWRHPDRPMIQINAPYRFVSDDLVWMTQCEPFMHYNCKMWPGLVFGGRMPIHIWPRVLMWAFEWFEPDKDLILKRGEPWFYVMFETENPERQVRVVQAEMTPELRAHTRAMDGVAGHMNNTFSLFQVAKDRRPKTLLKEKEIERK